MINTVESALRAQSGYAYSETTLRATIEAGYDAIPDGAVIGSAGGQVLHLRGGAVECVTDGRVTRRTPVADGMRDQVIMMYAARACRIGIHCGG